MSLKPFLPVLVLGLAACSGGTSSGTGSSVSSITSTTATGATGAASSLTVGQIVQVTFDATGAAATIVAGQGGFGHHGGMMAFGPLGGDGPEGMPHRNGTDTVTVDYTEFGVVHGPVDAVDASASTITILGITIAVDGSTVFGGGVAALTDVQAGVQAQVRVTVAADGSLTATSVRVRVAGIGGALTAIASDGSSITVLGRTIAVTDATTITVVEPPVGGMGDGRQQGGMMGGGSGMMGRHGG